MIATGEVDGTPIDVCGPAMEESFRESMGVKWCFRCRCRVRFDWVVWSPVTLDDWYWDPTADSECSRCHEHGSDLFPGRYYVMPDV